MKPIKIYQVEAFVKLLLTLSGCAVLVFTLGRCSPISPSVSKSQLLGGNAPSETALSSTNVRNRSASVFEIEAPIVSEATYQDITQSDQAFLRESPDLLLSEEQLQEFKVNQSTTLQILHGSIEESLIFIQGSGSLSAQESAASPVKLNLRHMTGNHWILSMKPLNDIRQAQITGNALAQIQNLVITFPKKVVTGSKNSNSESE